MKRTALILAALMCIASRHPDRMVRSDIEVNLSGNRGDATDRSINSNNGTLNNGAVVTAGNRYFTFDGTNDDITIPDATSNDLGSAFTISLWFNPSSPGSASRTPIAKWNTTATRRSYFLSVDYTASQRFGCLVSSDGAGSGATTCIYYTSATTPPTSGWNHLVWVYDASAGTGLRHKLYLNGVAQSMTPLGGSDNAVTPLVTPDPLYIGQAGNNAAYWKGDLDEVRVFKRLLTYAEVAALYSSGRE